MTVRRPEPSGAGSRRRAASPGLAPAGDRAGRADLAAAGIDPAVAGPALAVVAHPDDESFGLGAVLSTIAGLGMATDVLCLTRGEASTLGEGARLGDLRAAEVRRAVAELGVRRLRILDHPDGGLADLPLEQLAADVRQVAAATGARLLVTFDLGGVTGHADHHRATEAALAARTDLPVLGWALEQAIAEALNAELGTGFVGRAPAEVDLAMAVDRSCQLRAVACHRTQSTDNPVLHRRLELQGDREVLRWLRAPVVREPPEG